MDLPGIGFECSVHEVFESLRLRFAVTQTVPIVRDHFDEFLLVRASVKRGESTPKDNATYVFQQERARGRVALNDRHELQVVQGNAHNVSPAWRAVNNGRISNDCHPTFRVHLEVFSRAIGLFVAIFA